MKSLFVTLLIAFFSVSCALCQKTMLQKRWIHSASSACEELNSSYSQEALMVLDFFSSDSVQISLRPQSVLNNKGRYSVNDRQLKLDYNQYIIKKLAEDTLILEPQGTESCKKLLFISENLSFQQQLKQFTTYQGDTVYFPTTFNSPTLEGVLDYHAYFASSATRRLPRKQQECSFLFRFIVSKEGEVISPSGSGDCLENGQKFIMKTIEGTEGKWKPMCIGGKAVNTIINIRFKHMGKQVIPAANH